MKLSLKALHYNPVRNIECTIFAGVKILDMALLTVGSVAFDAIETPFGKTDKIIGVQVHTLQSPPHSIIMSRISFP